MFGDEPYGNYNRILLSNVLNGSQDAEEIFLNPLAWYAENDITLHAGARVDRDRPRGARCVSRQTARSERYDKLMIATGSRPFMPPMEGLTLADGSPSPASSSFAPSTTATQIAGYAPRPARPWSSAAGCWAWRRRAAC